MYCLTAHYQMLQLVVDATTVRFKNTLACMESQHKGVGLHLIHRFDSMKLITVPDNICKREFAIDPS